MKNSKGTVFECIDLKSRKIQIFWYLIFNISDSSTFQIHSVYNFHRIPKFRDFLYFFFFHEMETNPSENNQPNIEIQLFFKAVFFDSALETLGLD